MMTGSGANLRFQRDARFVGVAAHRLDDVGDRAVHVEREALDRSRPRDVAEVVEHALQGVDLAVDGAGERFAVFGVVEHAHDQLAAVADVLNRVREVVDEPGRHAAEHGLPLLLPDVFGQLDELVGHAVEGVAELLELVLGGDRDALIEPAFRDGVGAAHELEDRPDERASEEDANGHRDEKGDADDEAELQRQLVRHGVRFAARLLDHDGPIEGRQRRGHAEHLHAALVGVLQRGEACVALTTHEAYERLVLEVVAACDTRFLVRVAVGDEPAVGRDDQRVALLSHADPIDHPPHFLEADPANERS